MACEAATMPGQTHHMSPASRSLGQAELCVVPLLHLTAIADLEPRLNSSTRHVRYADKPASMAALTLHTNIACTGLGSLTKREDK